MKRQTNNRRWEAWLVREETRITHERPCGRAAWRCLDSLRVILLLAVSAVLLSRNGVGQIVFSAPHFLNSNAATDRRNDDGPQVTTDGAGTWVAVWNSSDSLGGSVGLDEDILFSRSTDLGISWTAPAPLNSNAAIDSYNDVYPEITTDCAGTWLAVWHLRDTLGPDGYIRISRSTDAGATWSFPVPLNTNPIGDAPDRNQQVTTDGAGLWIAVWESVSDLGGTIGSDLDILVSRSTDAGETWSPPAALNSSATTDTGSDWNPQVTTDGAGNWVAVWQSYDSLGGMIGTDNDILVARSTDGGVTWSDPAPLNPNAATDIADDWVPQVTTDGVGTWVAIWLVNLYPDGSANDAHVVTARSTDAGITWSDPVPLDTNAYPYHCSPQLTTDGAGQWIALWERRIYGSNYSEIFASYSTDSGETWTPPTPVNSNYNHATDTRGDDRPQLTTDGLGNWVAVWESWDLEGDISEYWDHDIVYTVNQAMSDVTVNQRAGQADPTNSFPIWFDVQFGSDVTGFEVGDVVFTGTADSIVYSIETVSPSFYRMKVTAGRDGTIVPMIPPSVVTLAAGSPNTASISLDNSVTLVREGPGIRIGPPSSMSLTASGETVQFPVTYTGAANITLSASNIALNTTGNVVAIAAVSGAGNTSRTVTVSALTGRGMLSIFIPVGSAMDAAGNLAPSAGPSESCAVNIQAPCFIATAAYGSPLAERLIVFRRFRDEVLLKTAPGAALVDFYYRTSPPIADQVAAHPWFARMVRAVLTPAAWLIEHFEIVLMAVAGLLGSWLWSMKRRVGWEKCRRANVARAGK